MARPNRNRLLWLLLPALCAAAMELGCQSGAPAIQVRVQIAPAVKATCIRLTVHNLAGGSLGEETIPRPSDRDELRVAVYRGEFPERVSFQAEARLGADCQANPTLNVRSESVIESFVAGPPRRVDLLLEPPGRDDDFDGDGYTAEDHGGPDCNDRDPAAYPNAPEDCTYLADLDCDGRLGCARAECGSVACDQVPVQLVFTSPEQTLDAGTCSAPVRIEPRNRLGTTIPVLAATPVSLMTSPADAGLQFYAESTCSQPLPSLVIPKLAATAAFHFRGNQAGTVFLSMGASGLDGGTQREVIVPGPPAMVTFATMPQTVLAGRCSEPLTVMVTDQLGNPSPVMAGTTVTLAPAPNNNFKFYSDPACATTAVTRATLTNGINGTVYFKAPTGGTVTVTASSGGLTDAQQVETIRSTVLTGSCTMAGDAGTVDCPISPPLYDVSKTFMVFQSSVDDMTPNGTKVLCRVQDASRVSCARAGTGDGGTVAISWQTAELPQGIRVQQVQAACDGGDPFNVSIQPLAADGGQAFLLVSSAQTGQTIDGTDFQTARLTSGSNIEVRRSGGVCVAPIDIQVVDFNGASVTRGEVVGIADGGTTLSITGLPTVDTTRTVLLYMWRASGGGSLVCDRMLRGHLTSGTRIDFYRGYGSSDPKCAGQPIDAITWERVQFPTGTHVQQVVTSLSPTTSVDTFNITSVDTTRAITFAGGQWASGQASGEGTYADDDVAGDMLGIHTLTAPDRLQVNRSSAKGAARWSSFVVELSP